MSDIQSNAFQTITFVSWSDADAASNLVVAAHTLYKIRVMSYVLNAAGGENDVSFIGGATAITGAFEIANNATISASSPYGLFETAVNEDLDILQSAATLVAGHLSYILV